MQEWLDTGVLPQSFTVTGHSLGGFLATDLTVDAQFANNITCVSVQHLGAGWGIFGDLTYMMQRKGTRSFIATFIKMNQ
ncbi:MAG: hypothetical protein NMNS02_23210 [Nitrosomonas sp.]|nr:MAG: hypothetical protein NMNS02_23210 [Nitrosomonas sp.]